MSRFRRPSLIALLGLAVCCLPGVFSRGQSPGKSGLRTVTYEELGQLVRSLKGKVVVVYFWADY